MKDNQGSGVSLVKNYSSCSFKKDCSCVNLIGCHQIPPTLQAKQLSYVAEILLLLQEEKAIDNHDYLS